MLDTFPFPGGTTTCEALWMGVPTLTLAGKTLLERQGMSMLTNVGLSDWIADNTDDYVQKAIHFCQKTDYLATLRNSLRSTMALSPLVDAPRFAHDLEQAFQKMWHEKMD
jgi:predicted O-linked N-acetylglucosamine transferase (SPINDLY family)